MYIYNLKSINTLLNVKILLMLQIWSPITSPCPDQQHLIQGILSVHISAAAAAVTAAAMAMLQWFQWPAFHLIWPLNWFLSFLQPIFQSPWKMVWPLVRSTPRSPTWPWPSRPNTNGVDWTTSSGPSWESEKLKTFFLKKMYQK